LQLGGWLCHDSSLHKLQIAKFETRYGGTGLRFSAGHSRRNRDRNRNISKNRNRNKETKLLSISLYPVSFFFTSVPVVFVLELESILEVEDPLPKHVPGALKLFFNVKIQKEKVRRYTAVTPRLFFSIYTFILLSSFLQLL
jgi:hypothetical protein